MIEARRWNWRRIMRGQLGRWLGCGRVVAWASVRAAGGLGVLGVAIGRLEVVSGVEQGCGWLGCGKGGARALCTWVGAVGELRSRGGSQVLWYAWIDVAELQREGCGCCWLTRSLWCGANVAVIATAAVSVAVSWGRAFALTEHCMLSVFGGREGVSVAGGLAMRRTSAIATQVLAGILLGVLRAVGFVSGGCELGSFLVGGQVSLSHSFLALTQANHGFIAGPGWLPVIGWLGGGRGSGRRWKVSVSGGVMWKVRSNRC